MTPTAQLAYCESTLADPGISPDRRATLAAKAEHLRAQLAGRCRECGRAADHLVDGKGSHCTRKGRAA